MALTILVVCMCGPERGGAEREAGLPLISMRESRREVGKRKRTTDTG